MRSCAHHPHPSEGKKFNLLMMKMMMKLIRRKNVRKKERKKKIKEKRERWEGAELPMLTPIKCWNKRVATMNESSSKAHSFGSNLKLLIEASFPLHGTL